MSAHIAVLTDNEDNEMYPLAMTDAVGNTTTFDEDGNITTTMDNGHIHKATFLENGDIEETVLDSKSNVVMKKVTSFADNGTINTRVIFGEGE